MGGKRPATVPRRNKGSDPEPAINITPLVDVVLVLLIIFMVVTPAIMDGEHVELPKIENVDKDKENNPIELTLTVDEVIVLEEQRYTDMAKLKAKLVPMHEIDPERKLMLKTDKKVPYRVIRKMFAMVQEVGFRGVKLKVTTNKQDGVES